ncbi:MAG: hypothetical protein OHK0046_13630 [Anaerolineae bacterium]
MARQLHSDPNPTSVSPAQEQMRKIQNEVKDLIDVLRNQRDVLRQRGMNLPGNALDNLRVLKGRIDTLSRQLVNSVVELQSLRALADTTALINSALETDVVLNQVMDTVISLTGAERGYIVLKNRLTGELDEFRVARGIDQATLGARGDDPNARGSEFIVSKTIVNDVARTGEPVLTDNATNDPRYEGQQSIVGFALRSILAVPLKVRDEVIGVVYCDNRIMVGLFRENDRDILAAFANQAGVAIENARLFEETRAQLQQITEIRDLMNNIFESIISGVITVNRKGFIVTCNRAACEILGVQNPLGVHLQKVMPPMSDEFYDILTNVMRGGAQRVLEVEPTLPEQGMRTWNVIVSSLRDGQGIALVLDDLTDQKLHEAQMQEVRRFLPLALVENIRSLDDVELQGQERTITMIATDVRGFTTFSEKLQPEELMETINKYLSVASDGINLYEGIVDKYMGDAVTGLFNTQLNPQEDHAVRAVRAALSIIYDLYALHEVIPEGHTPLFFGIGIHTGPAFIGNMGGADRKEFSALGEAATLSKVLESNAGPGEILISEATYALVGSMFECEARVPEKTKGHDIQKVYQVKGRKKGATTGTLFLDPELAELLKDIGND